MRYINFKRVFILIFLTSLLLNANENKSKIDYCQSEWEPLIFIDTTNKKASGMIIDYLNLLEEKTNLEFNYIYDNNWSSVVNRFQEGSITLLPGLIDIDVSKDDLVTKSIFKFKLVLAGLKTNKYIDSLETIVNEEKVVAVGYDSSVENYLKLYYPNIKTYLVNTTKEGLLAVENRQADYFLEMAPIVGYGILSGGLKHIKIVGILDDEFNIVMGVKSKELQEKINEGIEKVTQEEIDTIYKKYIQLEIEEKIDYKLVLYVFLGALFVILGFVMWLVILKGEIKRRNKAEKRVKATNKKLQQVADELKVAKDIAENLAKQRSEFLANMSHEIRTPMNSVIGFTEILDKEITNPLHKEYLSSIKKGGESLLRIINDILDLSKIEAGKFEIKSETINPNHMFMEIESIFHSKIISKNVSFIMEIDKSLPEYIISDAGRIRQILFNLIGNAIKFTEKGHIKLKVSAKTNDKNSESIDLCFSVEDTGIGIEKENLKSIFEAFEQQKNQDIARYGGTGLGLAICLKLVNILNGKIEVESEKGVGTTFKVVLKDIEIASSKEEEIGNSINVESIKFADATILVVDDVIENRNLILAALKEYPFKIIEAENGEQAINRVKNLSFDVILMDLRMPVMDGYEAVSILKNSEKWKNIPVIALTASVMGKDLEKVSKYGFDGYLRKPVIIDDLIFELTKHIEYETDENINDERCASSNNELNKEAALKFIEIVEKDIMSEYEEIKDKGDFSLIEEFANKISNLSKKYKLDSFTKYSNELIKNIETFDIDRVDYLMNSFPSKIEELKKEIS